jgi:hypothetical protein
LDPNWEPNKELQTANYMYDEQPTLFPFSSDQEPKTLSMTQASTSADKTKLASLGKALGKSAKGKAKKVIVEGISKAKSRGASKAAEGANKRDGETISTSSESRAHVNRKARVEKSANVVSPHGKEKTPTDEDKAIEESGREAETVATVSLEDEAVKVKEKETAVRKKEYNEEKNKDQENGEEKEKEQEKETDGMDVNVAEVDNEEDYNMITANEKIEVEDNTKANANKEGKQSIEELNKGPKSNIIYEWPEGTKFTRTLLAKKIPPVAWKKKEAFTTLEPDEAPTAGKSLMVAVAEYGNAWKENFQGKELNDKTVTKKYCDAIANALVMPNRLQCIWLRGFILK